MTPTTFADLELSAPVLEALATVGYESPSPIQAATIPVLLAGRDMLGQAQTGTARNTRIAADLSDHCMRISRCRCPVRTRAPATRGTRHRCP
jgi:hypothetical protein